MYFHTALLKFIAFKIILPFVAFYLIILGLVFYYQRALLYFPQPAVTPEQAEAHGLPSAPPKPTDRRRFSGMTWQCEALPPDVLADIVRGAILERLEPDAYNARLAEEQALRDELTARLVRDGAP